MSKDAPVLSSQPSQEPARHSDLPWCIPAGKGNGFIICAGDDPEKPGSILMIVTSPKGRQRVLTDADINDNTALMVAAVNSHASLKARIEELEKALGTAISAGSLLLQTAIGCATNHYGHDHELHGLPGWLVDTEKQLVNSAAALPQSSGVARAEK